MPVVLHVGPPQIKCVPVQSYMKPNRCAVLVRPTCFENTSDGGDELDGFISRLYSFEEKPYSVQSATQLLVQTLVQKHTQFQISPVLSCSFCEQGQHHLYDALIEYSALRARWYRKPLQIASPQRRSCYEGRTTIFVRMSCSVLYFDTRDRSAEHS